MPDANDVLTVAGKTLDSAAIISIFSRYSLRTLQRYDLPGAGQAGFITHEEIARTRAVSSRISRAEGDWFISRAQRAPWLPQDADLRDADPAQTGGTYDQMSLLFAYFVDSAPSGVGRAKISKVLHLKLPGLYPILDSRLRRDYLTQARVQATKYPDRGFKTMHWAAIREDLIDATRAQALNALRHILFTSEDPKLKLFATLSDLRLLDILAW